MKRLRVVMNLLSEGGVLYLYYRILEIKFWRLFQEKKWSKALKVGGKVVTYFSDNKMLYISLAECYRQIGKSETAFNMIEKTMNLNFNLNDCVQQLECNVRKKNEVIHSKYVFLGGIKNFGFIEHELGSNKDSQKYLTKISKKEDITRELLFYKYIYPKVKSITPKLIHLHKINSANVYLITMEKIDSIKVAFNKELLNNIIENNNSITSIKYGDIYDWYPLPNFEEYGLIDENSPSIPIRALKSFVSVHKKSTNEYFFSEINKRMEKSHYSQESIKLMSRLKKVILTYKLYDRINPKVHYSVQHGDLTRNNMVMEKRTSKLYFIDWGHMRIGPRYSDMAGFLGFTRKSFEFIENNYLSNPLHKKSLDPLEKIFFIYALIITWFIVLSQKEFDGLHEKYLIPAVELVEKLSIEVVNDTQIV